MATHAPNRPNRVTVIRARRVGLVNRTLLPVLAPTTLATAPIEGFTGHFASPPCAASTDSPRWGVDPFASRYLRAPGGRSRALIGPPSLRAPRPAPPVPPAPSDDLGSMFVDLKTLFGVR